MNDNKIQESFLSSLLTVFGAGSILSMVWKLYRATKDAELKRIVQDTHSSEKVISQRAATVLQRYYDDKRYKKYFKK